ncbi:MAG TPA: four helix bundle protein [Tepidisphaeraceae bacterium]|nr:four helix bundle protein [Tepidisphaeraceae bacterium]
MLAKVVYRATVRMPREEQFGLTNQLRRAAVSIPSNIAEGFGRQSRPDLIKFLRVARGSLNELSTQIELAGDLGMLRVDQGLAELISELDRVLQGLIRSLERKRP